MVVGSGWAVKLRLNLNPPAQRGAFANVMYTNLYLSLRDQRFGGAFLVLLIKSTEGKEEGGVEGLEGYFDSAGGCWTTRTPAMRAGLKDRSQSAYAAPAPKPVERAMGHARPEKKKTGLRK